MYSTWFHQIRALAGREPESLDLLTPERLLSRDSAEKERCIYEPAAAYGNTSEPAGLKRL